MTRDSDEDGLMSGTRRGRATGAGVTPLLAAYDATWPGRDEPEDFEIAAIKVELDTAAVPADGVADVVDGRFRLAWPDADRYVCLGNEHQGVVTTAGCVLVESEATVAITIESSIGGFAIGD
jgi:hypothetical protein